MDSRWRAMVAARAPASAVHVDAARRHVEQCAAAVLLDRVALAARLVSGASERTAGDQQPRSRPQPYRAQQVRGERQPASAAAKFERQQDLLEECGLRRIALQVPGGGDCRFCRLKSAVPATVTAVGRGGSRWRCGQGTKALPVRIDETRRPDPHLDLFASASGDTARASRQPGAAIGQQRECDPRVGGSGSSTTT